MKLIALLGQNRVPKEKKKKKIKLRMQRGSPSRTEARRRAVGPSGPSCRHR